MSTSVDILNLMTRSAKPSKSERTREAIQLAAAELFAAHGYERTTVRDIAAAAQIDPAMIIRYFRSKDELFARVATFDLQFPDFSSVDHALIGETLVRHFLSLWEGESANSGLAVLLRSAASNEQAANKLRDIFMDQVVPALAQVGPSAGATQRAGLVVSQILGLALCRHVLNLPPVVALSSDLLIREVGKTVQRYVEGDGESV